MKTKTDTNIAITAKTDKYEYIRVLVADKLLADYELCKAWNYGIDCKKAGEVISIMLRRKIAK